MSWYSLENINHSSLFCLIMSKARDLSLVSSRHAPSDEKQSDERQYSWVYYPKLVRTDEIARSVIMLTTVRFVHLHSSIYIPVLSLSGVATRCFECC